MITEHEIEQTVFYLKEEVGLNKDDLISDIDKFLSCTGYYYAEEYFGDAFSAFSRSLGGGRYLIGYNKNHHWSEKFRRFTLAHELGHVSIPRHRSILDTQSIHYSYPEFISDNTIEREADRFAINFLAPTKRFLDAIKYEAYTKESILRLSDTFMLSSYATSIRFVELVKDLACSLIACHRDGHVIYEYRSKRMKEILKHKFINRLPIKKTTLTYEYIHGCPDEDSCCVLLNDWYQDLPFQMEANESVIELGYKKMYLTLLELLTSDFYNEADAGNDSRLPSEDWYNS